MALKDWKKRKYLKGFIFSNKGSSTIYVVPKEDLWIVQLSLSKKDQMKISEKIFSSNPIKDYSYYREFFTKEEAIDYADTLMEKF